MNIVFGIGIVIFVIVSLFLVLLVLIQSDKGGGISGAIGGGLANASSLIGTQDTANILTKLTTGFAVAYMVLCVMLSLWLSKLNNSTQESVVKKKLEQVEPYAPVSAAQQLPVANTPVTKVQGRTANQALPVEKSKQEK